MSDNHYFEYIYKDKCIKVEIFAKRYYSAHLEGIKIKLTYNNKSKFVDKLYNYNNEHVLSATSFMDLCHKIDSSRCVELYDNMIREVNTIANDLITSLSLNERDEIKFEYEYEGATFQVVAEGYHSPNSAQKVRMVISYGDKSMAIHLNKNMDLVKEYCYRTPEIFNVQNLGKFHRVSDTAQFAQEQKFIDNVLLVVAGSLNPPPSFKKKLMIIGWSVPN